MQNLPIVGAIALLLVLALRSVARSTARNPIGSGSPHSGPPASSEPTSRAFRPGAAV